jgi:thiol-disulfide isomerase/thioredoxin
MDVMEGLIVLAVAVAATLAIAGFFAWKNGRFGGYNAAADLADDVLTAEVLGTPLGDRATLVQFSSAFCAPCRATKVILADVAKTVEGIASVDIDVADNLDLAEQLSVMRTPTVFVLDSNGRIVTRASGQPRKDQVLAALATAVEA